MSSSVDIKFILFNKVAIKTEFNDELLATDYELTKNNMSNTETKTKQTLFGDVFRAIGHFKL